MIPQSNTHNPTCFQHRQLTQFTVLTGQEPPSSLLAISASSTSWDQFNRKWQISVMAKRIRFKRQHWRCFNGKRYTIFYWICRISLYTGERNDSCISPESRWRLYPTFIGINPVQLFNRLLQAAYRQATQVGNA